MLLVVLYHAGILFRGGFLGVDVFFVISGFVITASLLRERRSTGTISFRNFYVRRARRLLPAFAVATTITLMLAVPFGPLKAAAVTARTGASALFFQANTYLTFLPTGDYFGTRAQLNPLLHLWSLSVEEQFYFVFPLVLRLCWRAGITNGRHTRLILTLCIIGAFSMVAQISAAHLVPASTRSGNLAFYFAPMRFWEFLAGALIALTAARPRKGQSRRRAIWNWIALTVLLASALVVGGGRDWVFVGPLLAVASTAALIISGTHQHGEANTTTIGRLLSGRPLTLLGDLSYSWYLWHWPFIVLAHSTLPTLSTIQVVAAALSLVPAWGSTRWVENRFRFTGLMAGRRLAHFLVVAVATTALAAGALYQASSWLASLTSAQPFGLHLDQNRGCTDTTPVSERPKGQCVLTGDPSSGWLVLAGDSNAGQFSESAAFAAHQLGLRLTTTTAYGCPFIMLKTRRHGREDRACERFVASSIEWILQNSPRTVVFSTASDLWLSDGEMAFASDSGEFTTEPASKRALYTRALATMLEDFRRAGSRVILVHNVPKFRSGWDPLGWSATALATGPRMLNTHFSRAAALAERSSAFNAEHAAVKEAGVDSFDPFDPICPGETCSAYADGMWWYRDGLHISVAAAERLGPALTEAIKAAG